jgi:hypothetical protein
MRVNKQSINPRIGKHLFVLASVFVLFSGDRLRCQEHTTGSPIEVTISDLALHPDRFDGKLVRVRAILVFGWEGDNFMSDPNPQNLPSGEPAYVWLHGKTGAVRSQSRSSEQGCFAGYFHYVPKARANNGMFDPGPFQFDATEGYILEPQPRSLSESIIQGYLEEARKALHSGAKLNVWDEHRSLPLFEAIDSGHTDFAEELLAAGADPKLTGPDRETSLINAASRCNVRIAKVLLDRGVPVNASLVTGETALALASRQCPDGTMVQLLLAAGADPNANADKGSTALMEATSNPLVVEKLLKSGANPAAKSEYGTTAESSSCGYGDKDRGQVCALIRQALGKK